MSRDPVKLPPGQQLAAADKWPSVGESTPKPPQGEWTVSIIGEVHSPETWSLSQLQQMPQVTFTTDIHCVTRWSKPNMEFSGVMLNDLLANVGLNSTAKYLSFESYSDRNHSTSLPFEDAIGLQTMIALQANGQPLSTLHGGPVRTIVPKRYFYKSLKWLKKIEVLAEDKLGYWEAEAGYHNEADPWRQQRFMAAGITKQQMKKILDAKDFRGKDLRSFEAQGHALQKMNAEAALLRNANFRECDLQSANFNGANLSNAYFQNADLRGASFVGSDLDGVNFSGADLREVSFSKASLFGTSFVEPTDADESEWLAARIDQTTHFDEGAISILTPVQFDYVSQQLQTR